MRIVNESDASKQSNFACKQFSNLANFLVDNFLAGFVDDLWGRLASEIISIEIRNERRVSRSSPKYERYNVLYVRNNLTL